MYIKFEESEFEKFEKEILLAKETIKRKKNLDMALKEAYWFSCIDKYNDCDFELLIFKKMVSEVSGKDIELVRKSETKKVFLMISKEIFGMAVIYGFSDIRVESELSEFLEKNSNNIKMNLMDCI